MRLPRWKAGQVWYDTLLHGGLGPQASFASFAQATVNSARRVFTNDPMIAEKVRAAWVEVGLLQAEPADLASAEPVGAGRAQSFDSAALPATVAVRRTGGFAGTTKVGQLDLNSDPEASEVRHLLMHVGRQQISATRSVPDRFVYTVEYGDWQFTVREQDLTPELRRLVQVVLDRGGH